MDLLDVSIFLDYVIAQFNFDFFENLCDSIV